MMGIENARKSSLAVDLGSSQVKIKLVLSLKYTLMTIK